MNNRVAPKYNDIMTKSVRIGDTINGLIESTCTEVYNETNKEIVTTVNNLGDKPIVKYPDSNTCLNMPKRPISNDRYSFRIGCT